MKTGVQANSLIGMRLKNGRDALRSSSPFVLGAPLRTTHFAGRVPFDWDQGMLVHNAVVLQTSVERDEFIIMGGLQGFVTDPACVQRLKQKGDYAFLRRRCLRPDRRPDVSARTPARGTNAALRGVRLTRGRGWHWNSETWSEPHVVVRGNDPPDCVDRRQQYTGYHPKQPRKDWACEFDGRLSLASHGGTYHLYARSNLAYGRMAGGRFVQVTSSPDLERGWQPWRQVTLGGLKPDLVDIYFFAVQNNPVDNTTLMALFPLSEPPWACIAAAFSRDGVHFSTPVNLHNSRIAFRQHKAHSKADPMAFGYSARTEDHPVAGIVPDPLASEGSSYLLYLHHAVRGMTYRLAEAHVAAYILPDTQLREWTQAAMRELGSQT